MHYFLPVEIFNVVHEFVISILDLLYEFLSLWVVVVVVVVYLSKLLLDFISCTVPVIVCVFYTVNGVNPSVNHVQLLLVAQQIAP